MAVTVVAPFGAPRLASRFVARAGGICTARRRPAATAHAPAASAHLAVLDPTSNTEEVVFAAPRAADACVGVGVKELIHDIPAGRRGITSQVRGATVTRRRRRYSELGAVLMDTDPKELTGAGLRLTVV